MINSENLILLNKALLNKYSVYISDSADSDIYRKAIPVILKIDKKSFNNLDLASMPNNGLMLSYKVKIEPKYFNDKCIELRNMFTKDEIEHLLEFPYIKGFLVARSFHGQLVYNLPVGFSFLNNDEEYEGDIDEYLSSIPKVSSRFYRKFELESFGYETPKFSNANSSSRTLYKEVKTNVLNTKLSVAETIDRWRNSDFCPNALGIYILENLELSEFESNNFSRFIKDDILSSIELNETSSRDYIANLKKVKLGILKNGKIVKVIKTNMILSRNKNFLFGVEADIFRKAEYDVISALASEYGSESPVLLESFWIKKQVINSDILYDSDGNYNKTLFKEIDCRTHNVISDTMYLRNGDIVDRFGEILND